MTTAAVNAVPLSNAAGRLGAINCCLILDSIRRHRRVKAGLKNLQLRRVSAYSGRANSWSPMTYSSLVGVRRLVHGADAAREYAQQGDGDAAVARLQLST